MISTKDSHFDEIRNRENINCYANTPIVSRLWINHQDDFPRRVKYRKTRKIYLTLTRFSQRNYSKTEWFLKTVCVGTLIFQYTSSHVTCSSSQTNFKGYIAGATTRRCTPARNKTIRMKQLRANIGWLYKDFKKETCEKKQETGHQIMKFIPILMTKFHFWSIQWEIGKINH